MLKLSLTKPWHMCAPFTSTGVHMNVRCSQGLLTLDVRNDLTVTLDLSRQSVKYVVVALLTLQPLLKEVSVELLSPAISYA